MKIQILLMVLIMLTIFQCIKQQSISISPNKSGKTSAVIFSVQNQSGTFEFTLTLPQGFSLSDAQSECQISSSGFGFGPFSNLSCSKDQDKRQIKITNLVASNGFSFKNPKAAKGYQFLVNLNNGSNNISYKPIGTIQANTFSSVILTPSDLTTNTITTIKIDASISVDLVADDIFQIEFPDWDPDGGSNFAYFSTNTPTCQAGVKGSSLSTVQCNTSDSSNTLSVTVGSEISASSILEISATNFRTPPTTAQVISIQASTRNSNLSDTYQTLNTARVKVNSPKLISISINFSPTIVNQISQYVIQLSNDYFPSRFKGQVVFPAQINIIQADKQQATTTGLSPSSFIPNVSGSKITLPLLSLSNSAAKSITININKIKNPIFAEQTSAFDLVLTNQNGDSFLRSTPQTITPTAAELSNASAIPDTFNVGETNTYTIAFRPSTQILAGYKIKITPPDQIQLGSRPQICDNLTNLSAACQKSQRVFTLTVGDPPNHVDSQDISLKISNLINPLSTAQTSIFLIQITNNNNKLIESTTNSPKVTAVAGSITDIKITPSNQITTTQSVEYNFEFKTSGRLLQSGFNLELQLPAQIDFTNQSDALASCQPVQNFSTFACSIVSGSNKKITSDMNLTMSQYDGGNSAPLLKFKISHLINPRSTKPVTFKFRISKDGYLSYSGQKTIRMTTPVALNSVAISTNSNINGYLSKYTFTVNSKTTTLQGDFYQIQLPEAMQFSDSPSCLDNSANNLTCSLQSNQLMYVRVKAEVNASTPFQFKIESIYNPAARKQQSITINQSEKQGSTYYKISTFNVAQTYTSNYATIPNITVQASNSQIAQLSNYKFNIESPVSFIPSGTKILIQFPTQFPILQPSIDCTGITLIQAALSCSKISDRQIEINNGFPQYISAKSIKSIVFRVNNIKNGQTSIQKTSNFSVNLKIQSNEIISQLTSALTTPFTCGSRCLTCQNQPTECLTCYSKDVSSFIYYHTAGDKNCYQTCPAGFYGNNSTPPICSACDASCKQCDTGPSSCIACDITNPTHKYLNNNSCAQNCPDGKFVRSNICENCDDKCKTCNVSESNCTSCSIDTKFQFFFQLRNECLETCPDGYINQGSKCIPCQAPCATCTRTPTECTSCLNKQILFSNTCINTCPSGFIISSDGNECIKFEPKRDQVLYFIFLALFVFVLIILAIIRAVMIETKFLKSLLALESFIEVMSWGFLLWFLIRDRHYVSTGIVSTAILFHYLTNLVLFILISRLKKKDAQFRIHFQRYKCSHVAILVVSMIFSHKFYRFVVSFFFHQKKLNSKFQQRARFVRLLAYLTVISMFFTSLPIMFACCFNIFYSTTLLQLFYSDIQVFVITFAIIILQIIEACRDQRDFKKTKKKEKKWNLYQQNVGAGMMRSDISALAGDASINSFTPNSKLTIQIDETAINLQQICMYLDERDVRSEGFNNAIADDDNNSIYNINKSKRRLNNNYYIVERRRSFPLTPKTRKQVNEEIENQMRNSGVTIENQIGESYNQQNNYGMGHQFSFEDNQGEVTEESIQHRSNFQSYSQKKPGKIKQTMPINVAPNRLNAAETQGPDEQDYKFQSSEMPKHRLMQDSSSSVEINLYDDGKVPRFECEPHGNSSVNSNNNYDNNNSKNNNNNNVKNLSYNNYINRNKRSQMNNFNLNLQQLEISTKELQAAGAVPKLKFGDQTVDYISDIDLNEKSTERQLMNDLDDL